MKDLVFVSGVQKELAVERRAVVDLIRGDPLLGRFLDLFLFEDLPPRDRRADDFYTEKVDQASVYVGIFGNEYGFEDGDGVSPTEREFDRATERGITRLIFVKGDGDAGRTPKMVDAGSEGNRAADPPPFWIERRACWTPAKKPGRLP